MTSVMPKQPKLPATPEQLATAKREFMRARMSIGLQDELLAGPALLLKSRLDESCDTAWTDGVTIGYNPGFILSITHSERVGLIAHETLHSALLHPWRRGLRDHQRWNVACDYSVNSILKENGYALPAGALLDAQYTGKAPEAIYDMLPEDAGGRGQGPGGEGRWGGELLDAPTVDDSGGVAKQEMAEAMDRGIKACELAGKCPGSLKRDVAAGRSTVDWKSVLRRFVQTTAKDNYSWAVPSRRYIPRGLFLPSLRSDAVGPILIAVDTSGSINGPMLEKFLGEIRSLVSECNPRSVTVMACDTSIGWQHTFEQGEYIEIEPVGGGGTDFRPVFDAVIALEETPVAIVYLTDLYGSFPDACEIPTLWVTPTQGGTAPFGEIVEVLT